MLDHRVRAREFRVRADECRETAATTASEKFGACYRLLADYYNVLATLEEEFYERDLLLRTQNQFAG